MAQTSAQANKLPRPEIKLLDRVTHQEVDCKIERFTFFDLELVYPEPVAFNKVVFRCLQGHRLDIHYGDTTLVRQSGEHGASYSFEGNFGQQTTFLLRFVPPFDGPDVEESTTLEVLTDVGNAAKVFFVVPNEGINPQ